MTRDRSKRRNFDDAAVARAYAHRPDYSRVLYEWLVALPPRAQALLDLGCGPGKLAGPLASHFERVDAVDPSAPMLEVATRLWPDSAISWYCCDAEDFTPSGTYDLVTIGAAVHWMDPERLFPLISSLLGTGGVVAVLDGDGAHVAPWEEEWRPFLIRWLARLGQEWQPAAVRSALQTWRHHVDVLEERTFAQPITQTVESFIQCQHSRATWSRSVMGVELADEFDVELRSLLAPYANDGQIQYMSETRAIACQSRRVRRDTDSASMTNHSTEA